jgi:predicted ArsR family transcriptional regulator
VEVLRQQGYEPKRTGPDIELLNCPFFAVAHEHRDLVCPMNLAMLDAFAGDLRVSGLTARQVSHDNRCCVAFKVGTRQEPAAASP